jgi:hypothetical protein
METINTNSFILGSEASMNSKILIEELVRIGQEGVQMHGSKRNIHSLTVLGYLIYHLPTNPPREDLFSEGWKGLLVDLGRPFLYCEGMGKEDEIEIIMTWADRVIHRWSYEEEPTSWCEIRDYLIFIRDILEKVCKFYPEISQSSVGIGEVLLGDSLDLFNCKEMHEFWFQRYKDYCGLIPTMGSVSSSHNAHNFIKRETFRDCMYILHCRCILGKNALGLPAPNLRVLGNRFAWDRWLYAQNNERYETHIDDCVKYYTRNSERIRMIFPRGKNDLLFLNPLMDTVEIGSMNEKDEKKHVSEEKQTLSEISETLREMTEKGEVMNEGKFLEVSKKLMKIHQSM